MNNTYPDLLIDKDKWEGPLNSLTNEIVVLIQKFSEMVNEDVLNDSLRLILIETNSLYLQSSYLYLRRIKEERNSSRSK